MINVGHLRTLQVVLDTGSFTAAARELNYTTSAVSQQIAALEKSLGVQLFERGPQNLRPTAAAAQLVGHAGEILAKLDDIEQDAQALAAGRRGRMRIAAFATASAQLLPRALARLVRASPDAEITLQPDGDPTELADAVHAGHVDLAVVFEYDLVPRTWPAGLRTEPILDEELVVICSGERRPAKQHRRHPITEFAHDAWVGNKAGSASHENTLRVCAQAGFEPLVRFRSDDFDVVRGLVRADLGVALVPSLALGVDRSISLVRLEPPLVRRRVSTLHRAADPNPLVPAAVDAIRDAAAEFATWTTGAFGVRLDGPLAVAHPHSGAAGSDSSTG